MSSLVSEFKVDSNYFDSLPLYFSFTILLRFWTKSNITDKSGG